MGELRKCNPIGDKRDGVSFFCLSKRKKPKKTTLRRGRFRILYRLAANAVPGPASQRPANGAAAEIAGLLPLPPAAPVHTVGLSTKGAIKRARASDLARSARRKEVKIWRASFSLELRACAACGRKSKPGISAAVEKRKDQRKPAAFFGHRKVEYKNRFSFHKRKEKWVLNPFSPDLLCSVLLPHRKETVLRNK